MATSNCRFEQRTLPTQMTTRQPPRIGSTITNTHQTCVQRTRDVERHTEKSSVSPRIRKTHAHPTTDTVKAALPSIVFAVVDVQRWRTSLFPTIDAYSPTFNQSATNAYQPCGNRNPYQCITNSERQDPSILRQPRWPEKNDIVTSTISPAE